VSARDLIQYSKTAYSKWSDHHAARLGASVAFYSILSFAPLLVLVVGIIGLVFGNDSAHGALVNEARQAIGDRGGAMVDSLLKNAQKPGAGIFAAVASFITLLFGASGVFMELQDALNIMWDAPEQNASGFKAMIKQRLFSFGMVLSVGFLLLISLLLSTGLAYIQHSFSQIVPVPPFVLQIGSFLVSFAVITGLFALMFKYVPDVRITWQEVIVGAIGTALLFTIGKLLLGLYLGKASVGSTYGAAGSLVAVVVWIYYSAQIFFFGAEFTRVYADHHREEHVPETAQQPRPLTADIAAAQPSNGPSSSPKGHEQVIPTPPLVVAVAAGAEHSTAELRAPGPVSEVSTSAPATTVAIEDPALRRSERSVGRQAPAAVRAFNGNRTIGKPKLLAALVTGFLLGRLVGAPRRNEARE
jgi:membrane protein